jgi:hypothetical protein
MRQPARRIHVKRRFQAAGWRGFAFDEPHGEAAGTGWRRRDAREGSVCFSNSEAAFPPI